MMAVGELMMRNYPYSLNTDTPVTFITLKKRKDSKRVVGLAEK